MVSDEAVQAACKAYDANLEFAWSDRADEIAMRAALEAADAARVAIDRDVYEKAVSALATANWFGNDSRAVAARDRLDALIEPFLAPSTSEDGDHGAE
jgi:hypothetical protein